MTMMSRSFCVYRGKNVGTSNNNLMMVQEIQERQVNIINKP